MVLSLASDPFLTFMCKSVPCLLFLEKFADLWSSLFVKSLLFGILLCVLCAKSLLLCPTLWYPVDHSLSDSSVHGIFQARILEWVAITYSRGSSRGWNPCLLCLLHWRVGSLPLAPPGKHPVYTLAALVSPDFHSVFSTRLVSWLPPGFPLLGLQPRNSVNIPAQM